MLNKAQVHTGNVTKTRFVIAMASSKTVIKNALRSPRLERKHTGTSMNPCVIGCSEASTSRWAPKAHRIASKTQQNTVRQTWLYQSKTHDSSPRF